jgi:hypothetical protein
MCVEAVWGDSIKRSDIWWLTVMDGLKPRWTAERAAAHVGVSPALLERMLLTGYDHYVLGTYRQFDRSTRGKWHKPVAQNSRGCASARLVPLEHDGQLSSGSWVTSPNSDCSGAT